MDDDVTTEETKSISTDAYLPVSGYRVTKYGYVVGGCSGNIASATTGTRIVKHTGYVVQLGAGSAYGVNGGRRKKKMNGFWVSPVK